MSNLFVVYKLTPPPEMKREDFVRFVQEEVFPVVNMQFTRAGVVDALDLLTNDATDEYIWVITWNEQGGFASNIAADARQKLESSGILVSEPGFYYEVAGKKRQI